MPELVLCDETTGALDENNREKVFDLLLELVRSSGRTLVLATHDPELAGRCDRTVRMRDGRIGGEAHTAGERRRGSMTLGICIT